MPTKSVLPSITEVAFDCPHCGAYTTQTWFGLHMTQRPTESRLPFMVKREFVEQFRADRTIPEEAKKSALGLYERMLTGLVFFDKAHETRYSQWDVENLNL